MKNVKFNEKGQAMPEKVVKIGREAFLKTDHTEIRWLGGAGIMLNIRGTVILIDPVMEGFDMPLLFDCPITPSEVPEADALLITHIDNDHFSRPTCVDLKKAVKAYHAPAYVASEIAGMGLMSYGHGIETRFHVGRTEITLTPTRHNWQAYVPEYNYREWKEEDYCGYQFDTPDGRIWLPGDSQLLECHLHMPEPDVILMDFSDNEWHIGFDNAVRLADTYPEAKLICIHWGTVDAPEFTPFNADPGRLQQAVVNPERVLALCPGEAFTLEE